MPAVSLPIPWSMTPSVFALITSGTNGLEELARACRTQVLVVRTRLTDEHELSKRAYSANSEVGADRQQEPPSLGQRQVGAWRGRTPEGPFRVGA